MQVRPLVGLLGLLAGVSVAVAQPGYPPDALPPTTSQPAEWGWSGAGMPGSEPAGMPGEAVGVDVGGATGTPYRWWLHGEYLLAYTRPLTVPALASVGPVGSNGILDQPGASAILGGRRDFGGISGYRFGGGAWLDPCPAIGVEWSAFFVPAQSTTQTATASPGGVLARPFFDTALNIENSRVLTAPGFFDGSVSETYRTFFWGAEAGVLLRVVQSSDFSLDQVYHFRYYSLEDSLLTSDSSTATGGGVVAFNGQAFAPPATVSTRDFYSVVNRWYGGSAGLRLVWSPGRWQVGVTARLGVGAAERNVAVRGSTTLTGAGPEQTVNTGFYTAGTGTATFKDFKFSFAPDVQVKAGYRVTDWLTLHAGYQFLSISDLARAPDLYTRRLNPGRIPSTQNFGAAAQPLPNLPPVTNSDYWLHGLTAGLMFTF